MTGLDRLRNFARRMDELSVWPGGRKLLDIADQIERETERRPTDTTMSAYDLLGEEDREALRWVSEHGGLSHVKEHWSGRVAQSHVHNMAERHKAKIARMQSHIEFVQRKCRERQEHICELNKLKRAYVDALNGVCKRLGLTDGTGLPDMPEVIWTELDRRIMPEGMEWPTWDDSRPLTYDDAPDETIAVALSLDGSCWAPMCDLPGTWYERGERVRRPAPKVLDADGAEIRVGDSVWDMGGNGPYEVVRFTEHGYVRIKSDFGLEQSAFRERLTHRAPVLATDGRPLREGETVWGINGATYRVTGLHDGEVFASHIGGSLGAEVESGGSGLYCLRAEQLTHERSVVDTWERLDDDATLPAATYCERMGFVDDGVYSPEELMACDLVRRAKALAGVSE